MTKIDRRQLLLGGAKLASALVVAPLAGARAAQAAECVEPDSEPLRASLNYADPSPHADKACKGCGFFKAQEGSACGRCDIMTGPVHAPAWCESWAPRS